MSYQVKYTDGAMLEVFNHEYWYLAPKRITFEKDENVRPLDFALTLHNAKIGRGFVVALDDLLKGINPTTLKNGASKEAELLLEKVRLESFPEKPSRLRSYFLNYDKRTAEIRKIHMFRDDRELVRCQVILNSAKFHHGDVRIYEALTGRPDDTVLAKRYWQIYEPNSEQDFINLEVIADSMLFFPDWEQFPTIDESHLARWNNERRSLDV